MKRARGADVLCQLGKTAENPRPLWGDESYAILSAMLEQEADVQALSSVISGLGHLGRAEVIPLLSPFRKHPDAMVRFSLTYLLGCFPNDKQSAGALLELMTDPDSDVRDWATFGLGVVGDLDSACIREALFERLADSDEDAREEAMVGLAKRHDLRVLSPLLNELSQGDPSYRVLEAAESLLGDSICDDCEVNEIAAAIKSKFAEHLK